MGSPKKKKKKKKKNQKSKHDMIEDLWDRDILKVGIFGKIFLLKKKKKKKKKKKCF